MFVATYKKIFLAISAVILLASIAIVATLGLNLGIDFTGGALTEIAYNEKPDKATLESKLNQLDLGGYSLREAVDDTGRTGYMLRTRDLSETERVAVEDIMTGEIEGAEITRFTSIGPVIGQELRGKATKAIIAVSLIIILYVAFAFRGVSYPVGSWMYGSITILALIHDVLVPTAVMSLLGYFMGVEVDVLFVMALLAVLGYSVNDTIVVFDRVRENLLQYRQEKKRTVTVDGGLQREEIDYKLTKPIAEIVGLSVSQTLMRSINTSVTTLLALVALYVLGGAVTQIFALILVVGVVAGTFSSICLANPLLILIAERKLAQTEQTKK